MFGGMEVWICIWLSAAFTEGLGEFVDVKLEAIISAFDAAIADFVETAEERLPGLQLPRSVFRAVQSYEATKPPKPKRPPPELGAAAVDHLRRVARGLIADSGAGGGA